MKIGGIYEKNLVFTLPTWRISSFFIDKSCVALGWDKLAEDLSHKTTQAIKKIYSKHIPKEKPLLTFGPPTLKSLSIKYKLETWY